MADFAGAVAAIKARLAANWSATPIGYMNGAEPVTRNAATGTPEPWVLAEIVGAGANIHGTGTPGDRVWLYDGLIYCHVFMPKGSGDDVARQHAVALGEIFRNAEFYTETPGHAVRCWAPRVDGGGDGADDGLWFRMTATIPFEYWFRDAPTTAHGQILNAAAEAGAIAVYDPDNHATWSLRDSGGTTFYSAVADGLGNKESLVQATEARQPQQRTLSTGRRVWHAPVADRFMLADFAADIVQPNTIVAVFRAATAVQSSKAIIDSFAATGGRQQLGTGTGNVHRMNAGASLDRSAIDTTWRIAQCNFDGAASALFLEGAQDGAAGDAGANALGGLGILAAAASTANFLGSLGPVILFPTLKSNAELAALRAKINEFYPIGVSE
jgi:hypothetical protein